MYGVDQWPFARLDIQRKSLSTGHGFCDRRMLCPKIKIQYSRPQVSLVGVSVANFVIHRNDEVEVKWDVSITLIRSTTRKTSRRRWNVYERKFIFWKCNADVWNAQHSTDFIRKLHITISTCHVMIWCCCVCRGPDGYTLSMLVCLCMYDVVCGMCVVCMTFFFTLRAHL